jgi:hypothetical protein
MRAIRVVAERIERGRRRRDVVERLADDLLGAEPKAALTPTVRLLPASDQLAGNARDKRHDETGRGGQQRVEIIVVAHVVGDPART